MATETKPDYYHLLGVDRGATSLQIESAFQSLEREFHGAGKPKNIDDVEWLRRLKKARDVLCDAGQRAGYDRTGEVFRAGNNNEDFGYDSAALKQMNFQVNNEINTRRKRWLVNSVLSFFGF